MLTTMGRLRNVLNEAMSLEKIDDDKWVVTPDLIRGWGDYPGFDVRGAAEEQYRKMGIYAPVLVKKSFEKDVVMAGRAPANATPKDVLLVFKTEAPVRTGDVTLVPAPGLADAVIARLAPRIAQRFKNVDVVTTVTSSKRHADIIGQAVAQRLNAQFLPAGVQKTRRPQDVSLDMDAVAAAGLDDRQVAELRGSLRRLQQRIASGGSASIRSTFHPKDRKFVKGLIGLGDELMDRATSPGGMGRPKVLLVDDVVTTGFTLLAARDSLEEAGYEVVGLGALFKMQDSR